MVSVVIVNWNSGPLLQRCILSLERYAPQCRIIIVDNASTDNSYQAVVISHPNITSICNNTNKGFATACNQGWRATDSEHILFLNPDTECFAGSVAALEKTFGADETIRAVGGCLIGADGRPQHDFNVRRFPTIGRVSSEMFFVDEFLGLFRKRSSSEAMNQGEAIDVDQPAAACLMVTRNALDSIGGFDESFYPAWFEDVDLCFRMHKTGGRIRYQPQARFLHHGGYSLQRMSRDDFLTYFHKNQIRYFRKHRGLLVALYVQKLIILGLLLRAAGSLLYPLVPGTSRIKSVGIFYRALAKIIRSGEVWQ